MFELSRWHFGELDFEYVAAEEASQSVEEELFWVVARADLILRQGPAWVLSRSLEDHILREAKVGAHRSVEGCQSSTAETGEGVLSTAATSTVLPDPAHHRPAVLTAGDQADGQTHKEQLKNKRMSEWKNICIG